MPYWTYLLVMWFAVICLGTEVTQARPSPGVLHRRAKFGFKRRRSEQEADRQLGVFAETGKTFCSTKRVHVTPSLQERKVPPSPSLLSLEAPRQCLRLFSQATFYWVFVFQKVWVLFLPCYCLNVTCNTAWKGSVWCCSTVGTRRCFRQTSSRGRQEAAVRRKTNRQVREATAHASQDPQAADSRRVVPADQGQVWWTASPGCAIQQTEIHT